MAKSKFYDAELEALLNASSSDPKAKLIEDFMNVNNSLTKWSIELVRNVCYNYVYTIHDSAYRPHLLSGTMMQCIRDVEYAKEVFCEIQQRWSPNYIIKEFNNQLTWEYYLVSLAWLNFINITEQDLEK